MKKARHGWDRSEGIKYTVSRFEEEEFQKWMEKGGKEKLRRKLVYFDFSPRKGRKHQPKEGRYWE